MILLPNGIQLPQTAQLVTPWKCLEVTEIATGKRILIKDFGFNPQLHKDPKEHAKPSLGSANERIIINESPINQEPEIPHVIITAKERFDHLKAKGWQSLSKEERINYQELKKQFEPSKNVNTATS